MNAQLEAGSFAGESRFTYSKGLSNLIDPMPVAPPVNVSPWAGTPIDQITDNIEGLLMDGQAQFLFDHVRKINGGRVLEVGSYYGRSTIAMAIAAKANGTTIDAVDTWFGGDGIPTQDYFPAFWRNVTDHGCEDVIKPIRGESAKMLPYIQGEYDFAFLDGSHQLENILCDFANAYRLVKPGGAIALHDVIEGWPGPVWVWQNVAARILEGHEQCGSLMLGYKRAE